MKLPSYLVESLKEYKNGLDKLSREEGIILYEEPCKY